MGVRLQPRWVQNALLEITYPEQVTSGETYTLSAKVTGIEGFTATPTGTVTFGLGSYINQEVPLDSEGTASVTRVALAVDSPTEVLLSVSYSGDSNYVLWNENGQITFVPAE